MPSAVRLVRSASLADVSYSHAVTAPAAARCVENLRQALADAGAELREVNSTRVLVAATSRQDLVTTWDVVHEAFAD